MVKIINVVYLRLTVPDSRKNSPPVQTPGCRNVWQSFIAVKQDDVQTSAGAFLVFIFLAYKRQFAWYPLLYTSINLEYRQPSQLFYRK